MRGHARFEARAVLAICRLCRWAGPKWREAHGGTLGRIAQFADIARPVMREKRREIAFGRQWTAQRPAASATKCRKSSSTSSARWRRGGDSIGRTAKPVDQILAELPAFREGGEIGFGCRNHAEIDRDFLRTSEAFEPPFLQHAQEARLRIHRMLSISSRKSVP